MKRIKSNASIYSRKNSRRYRKRIRGRRRSKSYLHKRVRRLEKFMQNAKTSRCRQAVNEETLGLTNGVNSSIKVNAYMHSITQGDSEYSRAGNQIQVNDLAFRASITLQNDNRDQLRCRFLVIKDRDTNGGVVPNSFDDFLSGGEIWCGYDNIGATRGKYQYLYDESFDFRAEYKTVHDIKGFLKPKGWTVNYDANTGTTADVESGQLYLVLMIEDPKESNTDTTIRFDTFVRFHFTDLK